MTNNNITETTNTPKIPKYLKKSGVSSDRRTWKLRQNDWLKHLGHTRGGWLRLLNTLPAGEHVETQAYLIEKIKKIDKARDTIKTTRDNHAKMVLDIYNEYMDFINQIKVQQEQENTPQDAV